MRTDLDASQAHEPWAAKLTIFHSFWLGFGHLRPRTISISNAPRCSIQPTRRPDPAIVQAEWRNRPLSGIPEQPNCRSEDRRKPTRPHLNWPKFVDARVTLYNLIERTVERGQREAPPNFNGMPVASEAFKDSDSRSAWLHGPAHGIFISRQDICRIIQTCLVGPRRCLEVAAMTVTAYIRKVRLHSSENSGNTAMC